MILVDTSVWVKHLRAGEPRLADLLLDASVLTHPFVIGELACGSIKNRAQTIGDLTALPSATPATDEEALHLIDDHKLWGRGIGWIDVHLLASALLSNSPIWTFDEKLARAADAVGKSFR